MFSKSHWHLLRRTLISETVVKKMLLSKKLKTNEKRINELHYFLEFLCTLKKHAINIKFSEELHSDM